MIAPITTSASGVHTDNAGDGGGTADVIQGNRVSSCSANGYGVWVFVPYLAPTVQDNIITDCTVGLAAFAQGAAVSAASLYEDDGASLAYREGEFQRTRFRLRQSDRSVRLDRGPLSKEEATAELLAWWNERR